MTTDQVEDFLDHTGKSAGMTLLSPPPSAPHVMVPAPASTAGTV